MMMLRAPSPGPPTLLRSTAGFSGVIVPYEPVEYDGAADGALDGAADGSLDGAADGAADAATDGAADAATDGAGVDPLLHAPAMMATAPSAAANPCLFMLLLLDPLRRPARRDYAS